MWSLPSKVLGRPSGALTAPLLSFNMGYCCTASRWCQRVPEAQLPALALLVLPQDSATPAEVGASSGAWEHRWSAAAHLPATGLACGTLLLFRSSSSGT